MKRLLIFATFLYAFGAWSQTQPLKPRPDAFPPEEVTVDTKALTMATTPEEMAAWDRYPTYDTYVLMMSQWAQDYPDICHLETIGTSVQGRQILCMRIEGPSSAKEQSPRPQFFYSSTIHGDELTGYVMMLRLIDTLLTSYGHSERLTALVDSVAIYINPLANPDGTYRGGNNTVQGSVRYNANNVDLNRNFPVISDQWPVTAKAVLQPENEAMIDYVSAHNFRLSANLHGGSEVMNYPWDSYTTAQHPHPQDAWWREVGKRFVDTCRTYSSNHFYDVTSSGYIEGGDWYVIYGGRQDYMNYYHNCLEMTMEISTDKKLSTSRLREYWRFLAPSFINYIEEIYTLPENAGISDLQLSTSDLRVFPNPATDNLVVEGVPEGVPVELYDMQGRLRLRSFDSQLSTFNLPSGVYLLRVGAACAKVVIKK